MLYICYVSAHGSGKFIRCSLHFGNMCCIYAMLVRMGPENSSGVAYTLEICAVYMLC